MISVSWVAAVTFMRLGKFIINIFFLDREVHFVRVSLEIEWEILNEELDIHFFPANIDLMWVSECVVELLVSLSAVGVRVP